MKHQNIISKMTLEEKCYLFSGKDFWQTRSVERLGIPNMMLSDGPHGVRKQEGAGDQLGLNGSVPATCFPTAATIANSWDPALGEEIGECLGEEAASQGVGVLLGPGLNIKRSPLCGRNFEYFSEDPYLAGKITAGYVRGIQKNGISACPKHFACNSQELRRMASDSILDERTFREIYLTGFEIAVKESHPKSIMSSYNRINGVYANENWHLLQEILRDEFSFDGFVVSDWGASNDHVEGVRNGSHLEMPTTGGDSDLELVEAVKSGRLSEEELDKRVDELLDVILPVTAAVKKYEGKPFDVDAHHKMAAKAAGESIVLLKNEGGILPLKKGTKVAVIGEFAQKARYQGAGSSVVNPTKLDHTMDIIKNYDLNVVGFEAGYPRSGKGDPAMRTKAVELAKQADVVLLYIGLDEISESEGLDRAHMKLPQSQVDLIEAVSAVNSNIVAVMSAGSSVEMPWLDKCKALIHGYLCGQAGAGAMLQAILGEINPSGKLAESYPLKYEDVSSAPYFPAKQRTAEYREGLFVGYRYFETANIPVLFPFGYGLSYTTFEYSDLKVSDKEATFTITNTGKVNGAEVAQLYVSKQDARVFRPAKELKGFTKVFLKTGESKTVTIPLDDKAFRYFNVKTNKFEVEGGEYLVLIGASAADIKLSGAVTMAGTDAPNPYDAKALADYYTGSVKAVSDRQFEELLGHPIPDGSWSGTLDMNDAICQMYYAKSWPARQVYKIMTNMLNKSIAKGTPDLNITFIYNMPFRGIAKMAGGMCTMEMAEGILTIVNGRFFKGAVRVIGGFFRSGKKRKAAAAIK
ncbi:glycoside hydrolase family 3 C-terminal domain-containing protein [Pseudoflavonifractor sp. 60]|uniref:beta-glucosidase n=1 Tax=Pseudoflavonifractor sp. 60 TaxID=2304576 RepID=UPI001FAC6312|nr:glycoside hydrolase family 3 C-terminal domain-containing protein [Pseudoflavonifractor sp. 60]